MKLLVFGATGSIGRQIVEQALEEGHRVTAFSRSASQLDSNLNLDTVEGNVLDFDSIEKAMSGHEAVLGALGAGIKGPSAPKAPATSSGRWNNMACVD